MPEEPAGRRTNSTASDDMLSLAETPPYIPAGDIRVPISFCREAALNDAQRGSHLVTTLISRSQAAHNARTPGGKSRRRGQDVFQHERLARLSR